MGEYLETIARVCHEVNRAYCEGLGDYSQPSWRDAPDWQRSSAIAGVEKALAGATPIELHESWCDHKRADGWVYGEVKDADKKTHPCLVPYGELPQSQRIKDYLFAAVVKALRDVL